MISSELITVRDYLRWCVSEFNRHDVFLGHGTDDPWDEALGLVLHCLSLPWDTDPRILDARLTLTEREEVLHLLNRRVTERLPLPYLTGKAWFAGLEFLVNEQVLVPRSPIAELIENQFEALMEPQQISAILDIGTGSGCIAIACAAYCPQAKVVATDISETALEVARRNIEKHSVCVELLKSDLFEQVTGQFDLIISNPPYVSEDEWRETPAEYKAEPKSALVSGEGGLAHARLILQQAADYLTETGILILEVGHTRSYFESVFADLPVIWLEFERGGEGVLMLTRDQLIEYGNSIKNAG